MNGNTMQPPVKQKPQGLYKISLWLTIIAVSVSAFVCILMILLTDFNDRSAADMFARICFVTWQIFWFGLISIFVSREHEHALTTLSRVVCIVGLILCVILLTIGIIQALSPTSFAVMLDNTKEAFSLLFYSTVFSIFALRGQNPAKNVEYAKATLVAMLGVFNVFAMILIFIGYASAQDMLGRFWAVFIILALVGLVVIEILKTLNSKGSQPTYNNYIVQQPGTLNGQPMMQPPYPQQMMQPPYPQQMQPPYPQQMQMQPPYPQQMQQPMYYGQPMMGYGPMNDGMNMNGNMNGDMSNMNNNPEPKKSNSKKSSDKKSDK